MSTFDQHRTGAGGDTPAKRTANRIAITLMNKHEADVLKPLDAIPWRLLLERAREAGSREVQGLERGLRHR